MLITLDNSLYCTPSDGPSFKALLLGYELQADISKGLIKIESPKCNDLNRASEFIMLCFSYNGMNQFTRKILDKEPYLTLIIWKTVIDLIVENQNHIDEIINMTKGLKSKKSSNGTPPTPKELILGILGDLINEGHSLNDVLHWSFKTYYKIRIHQLLQNEKSKPASADRIDAALGIG